jgi:hypothetical protein
LSAQPNASTLKPDIGYGLSWRSDGGGNRANDASPIIFTVVSASDFSWFGGTGPAATAAAFLAIVIFLDVFVIALLVEKSFDMFRSVLGTWLPFALIFLASWLTGWATAAH